MTRRDVLMLLGGVLGCIATIGGGLFLWWSPAIFTNHSPPHLLRPPTYVFDGYCPVTLNEASRWQRGDPQFCEQRGRVAYLFASAVEQERFRQDPERYMPVFSGNDLVLAVDSGAIVAGRREHGVVYHGRMYLFTSEASLDRFCSDPDLYTQR